MLIPRKFQVTLNMLNASETEDVDALGGDVKLEFDTTNDDVATWWTSLFEFP